MKQSHKTLLLWVLLILMCVALYNVISDTDPPRAVPFSEFVNDLPGGHVVKVEVEAVCPRKKTEVVDAVPEVAVEVTPESAPDAPVDAAPVD